MCLSLTNPLMLWTLSVVVLTCKWKWRGESIEDEAWLKLSAPAHLSARPCSCTRNHHSSLCGPLSRGECYLAALWNSAPHQSGGKGRAAHCWLTCWHTTDASFSSTGSLRARSTLPLPAGCEPSAGLFCLWAERTEEWGGVLVQRITSCQKVCKAGTKGFWHGEMMQRGAALFKGPLFCFIQLFSSFLYTLASLLYAC